MAEGTGTEQSTAQPPQIDVESRSMENRSMAILYGSETGNAEEIASELREMAERLRFYTVADEMNNFKLTDLLQFELVVFVTSTTGQGDMPINTSRFWRSLRRAKLNKTNCLSSVRFTIFGLGDSSYPKFNWAARKLQVRLKQLGASEFFKPGEGDERHDNGIDSIYLPWYQDLRNALLANYPLPESIQPVPDDVALPPRYTLRFASTAPLMDLDPAEAHFEPSKSAALTHVDNPRPARDQFDIDRQRHKLDFPADVARRDDIWERETGLRADMLDKDNIIRDHPEKYLLEKPPPRVLETLPPPDLLPIPGAFNAILTENTRVTPEDHWQDVRKLCITVPAKENLDRDMTVPDIYTGSTLILYPKNFPIDVQTVINLMGWKDIADKPLEWGAAPRPAWRPPKPVCRDANAPTWESGSARRGFSREARAPSPDTAKTRFIKRPKLYAKPYATLRDLLTHNLDFTAVPKRSFLRELAFFATEPREKERLEEMTKLGSEQEFYDYTSRPRRTILEILHDFPSLRVPFERALDLFPLIRGREFSIANGGAHLTGSDKDDKDVYVDLLVALVEYKTIIRKPREGLCSRYLKQLPAHTPLMVSFKVAGRDDASRVGGGSSSITPTGTSALRPLLAVATGTGVAPIRALVQAREAFPACGRILLFYGCRNEAADFHFAAEWAAREDRGDMCVIPAFSRDPPKPDGEGSPPPPSAVARPGTAAAGVLVPHEYDHGKNYVQHRIRRHAALVVDVLRRRPIVCVCGNAGRMPASVREALHDALVEGGVAGSRAEAAEWFGNPENVTFWQETW